MSHAVRIRCAGLGQACCAVALAAACAAFWAAPAWADDNQAGGALAAQPEQSEDVLAGASENASDVSAAVPSAGETTEVDASARDVATQPVASDVVQAGEGEGADGTGDTSATQPGEPAADQPAAPADGDEQGTAPTPANGDNQPAAPADPSQGAGEAGNAGNAVDPSQYERIEDGAYILGIGSDRVLDIAGGSMADKGNAQIYEDNESTSQRFRITNVGRDANHEWIYCITNIGSGRVLEAQGGKTSSGTNVSQYGFNGSEAQLWYIRQVEGEDGTIRYCFVNYKSGLLMTVDATDVSDAANVVLKKQRENALQQWVLNRCTASFEDGVYVIGMASGASAVLDVEAASTEDGAQIQIYETNNSVAQAYAVKYDEWSGYYYIVSYASGKALTVAGSDANGTPVQLYGFTGSSEQLWTIIKNGDGTFALKSAFGGRVLDVLAGSTANGTKVQIYEGNGTIAQAFRLIATTPVYNGGRFEIVNRGSDRIVLDVASGSRADGAQLQGYASNGSMAQKYMITDNGDGTYLIAAMVSGYYLGVSADGAVCQQDVSAANAMRWKMVPTNDGHFAIVSADGMYVLALRLASSDPSVRAYRSAGQLVGAGWTLRKTTLLNSGMYLITSFDDGDYALEMVGSSLSNKAYAEVWEQDGSYTQKWLVTSLGDDIYRITNVWSQRVLEVANSKADDGAIVWQNWWYGTDNQKWCAVWNGKGGIMFQTLLGNYALSTMGSYNASGIVLRKMNAASPFQGWNFVETSFGNTMSFSDRIKILDSLSGSGLNVYRSFDGVSSGTVDRIYKAIGNYENEGYSVGFVMIDLYSGASVSYGMDNYFYSASTIKGPYVMSLLKYKPWLLNSWGDALYNTINVSSNEAYAELRNNLGASTLDWFVDWTHAWGFDYSSHYVWYTPRQLCKLWVGMADYLMGNEQDAWWARDVYGNNIAIYSRQELAWKGVPIYAKSGWVNGSTNVHNEGYLVMDVDHPYVCVIMSNEIWQNNWKMRALMSAIDAAHGELV